MEVDGTVEFASAEQDVLLGKTVGSKYLIERYLGGGSMGAVYRAKQTALGKSVAIKVLRRGLARDPSFVARFHREARTAACFDHPNSIRVLDHGEDSDGLLYIVMELLEGESLHRILSKEGPLPLDRIVTLLSQVLGALAAAHDAGILHRDLKPENIIVAEGKDDEGLPADHVKVFDFGIAKLLGDRPEGISSWPGEHPTQAGLIVGTPEYMSPEQGQGLTLDARSDIYSVGVILFQMLTGHVPFEGSSPLGTLMLHLTEEPRQPSSVFPHGCPRLDEICIKALRKNRDERYQSAREMRVDLRNIIGLSAPMSMPGSVHRFGTLHGIGRVVPLSVPLEEASSSPYLGALTPALDSSEETASPSAPVRPVSLVDDEVETRDALSLVAGSVLPPPKRRGFGWLVAASLFAGAAAGALWFVRTQDATTHEAKSEPEAAAAPLHEARQWSPREDEQGRGIVQVQRGLGTVDGQGGLALAPSAEVPVTLPEVVPPAKVETPKNRGRSTAFGVPRRSPKGAAAAAKGDATPSESEVPTATPPSEPALPPMNKDAALRLAFGRMTTSGLEEASVRRLVQGAHGRAARCLREALEAEAPIPPGHGTLTIGSDGQGLVSTVSLSGLELPSITVLCITDAFHGVRVAEAGAAAGSADIGVDVIVP